MAPSPPSYEGQAAYLYGVLQWSLNGRYTRVTAKSVAPAYWAQPGLSRALAPTCPMWFQVRVQQQLCGHANLHAKELLRQGPVSINS